MANSIVSSQHNRAVVGLTQESMTNAYLVTRNGVIVSRYDFQQIVTSTFPDLGIGEITKRITSLLNRLERTRAEKLTPEGISYHQHLINNAVTTKLADLYQAFGSSASSCPPSSSELRSYQSRARDYLYERYYRRQFTNNGDYQQWLYRFFADERQVPQASIELLNGQAEKERYEQLAILRDERADLRKQYRNLEEGEERTLLLERLKQATATYEAIQPVNNSSIRKEYEEWYVSTAKINLEDVPKVIEEIVRTEETERHYVSGREMMSMLYPDDYFYSKETGADPLEPVVRIEEGIHVSGQHTKATLGATHGSIVGDLFKMYSPSHAEDLISRAKWMTDAWNRTRGMSLTLSSCETLDSSFADLLKDKIRAAKIEAFKLGPRSNNPLEEARRQEMLTDINRNVKNSAGKCAMDVMAGRTPLIGSDGKPVLDASGNQLFRTATNPDNSLVVMATSGSKGNKENISSIMTMIGQQDIDGRPIRLLPGGRSVPFFERNSRELGARGFVENNYVKGMTPAEFFLHQTAARIGLAGTALKTSETGYMQRRMLKSMEDAVVYPDNTVRNIQGVVIQYLYGEDGFSGDQLVMIKGKARFFDSKRELDNIKNRRKRGLPPLFKRSPLPSTELPRLGYIMPSFTERSEKPIATVEEDDDDDEEDEEPEEEVDASDISDVEVADDE